ncbi:MAG: selenocysteine-specific translation elongation factor [Myxococcales bacterium]|nr:selenocysteine-specific translation elongation factor [Myxococcales bacterium]
MLWGTAGHVDHGKTTLVRALTGVDCDRLDEERRRGITIELGFARWVLPDGRALSVVDVPGHERLVRTMLVGAAGLDAVLLVVSAEAGVMPQTREHLAACQVLGVERGVVALTFGDRVDDLEAAAAAVRADLRGTAFADAEIVPVAAPTGAGLDALAAAVARVADALPPRDLRAPALLPIDRAFSVEGFGTVVTGSLVRGRLRVGEQVDLVPRPPGLRARDTLRIKGLQSHGRPVDAADAGLRVAVNLACDRRLVERGAALCAPGSVHVGRVFDAEVRWLPHLGPPPRRARWGLALHVGAVRALADVRMDDVLRPGGVGTARVRLDRPAPLPAGARFVLRGEPDARHGAVVGGGRLLDAAPPRKRKGPGRAALAAADRPAAVELAVAEAGVRGATPTRCGAAWASTCPTVRAGSRPRCWRAPRRICSTRCARGTPRGPTIRACRSTPSATPSSSASSAPAPSRPARWCARGPSCACPSTAPAWPRSTSGWRARCCAPSGRGAWPVPRAPRSSRASPPTTPASRRCSRISSAAAASCAPVTSCCRVARRWRCGRAPPGPPSPGRCRWAG